MYCFLVVILLLEKVMPFSFFYCILRGQFKKSPPFTQQQPQPQVNDTYW